MRLSAEGLAKVLGTLEARLMRVIWDLDRPATAREIHERLVRSQDVALLTAVTVLNRLVVKRVLARGRGDGPFRYTACLDESAFLAAASRRVVEGILSLDQDAVAASFVDVLAERDPAHLQELARLIQRRLRNRGGR